MNKVTSKITAIALTIGLCAGSTQANIMNNIRSYLANLRLKFKSYFQKPLTPIQKFKQSVLEAFEKKRFRKPNYLPKNTLFKSKFHKEKNQWNVVLYQKTPNENGSVDFTLNSYKYKISENKKDVLLMGSSEFNIEGITKKSAKERNYKNINDFIEKTVNEELNKLQ